MSRRILSLAVILGLAGVTRAEDKKDTGPKADPADTPLELKITGEKTTYPLETGGQSPAEYKKAIEAAANPKGGFGGRPPAAPKVDLSVEIKNTSDKPVMVWTKGDPVVLTLELKGEGAANISPPLAFTQEFRLPQAVTIPAGKSVSIPVKSLTSGFRGASVFSYWTKPGDYELVAKLKTGMQPAPKGAMDFDGFGVVNLTSAPLKLTVEEKK
jgi:hypothetical protein